MLSPYVFKDTKVSRDTLDSLRLAVDCLACFLLFALEIWVEAASRERGWHEPLREGCTETGLAGPGDFKSDPGRTSQLLGRAAGSTH